MKCNDFFMAKSNLQIRIPEETLEQIQKLGVTSRSAFVREAVAEKLQKEMLNKLEREWIAALKRHPEDAVEAKKWLKVEAWES